MKHATFKAMERHGEKIDLYDLTTIRMLIEKYKDTKAWFYKKGHPKHTEKWIVEYKESLWYVVFDPTTRRVVTVLDDAHPEIVKRVVRR